MLIRMIAFGSHERSFRTGAAPVRMITFGAHDPLRLP
jgi:hypothetical protein